MYLDQNGDGGTTDAGTSNMVTVRVGGENSLHVEKRTSVGVYIHGYATFTVAEPEDTTRGSETTPGNADEVIENAFRATVVDSRDNGVPGLLVKFEVKDTNLTGGNMVFPATAKEGTLVDRDNRKMLDANNEVIDTGGGKVLYVRDRYNRLLHSVKLQLTSDSELLENRKLL